eukprot:TRINITY_DN10436_c0_g1_i2.p1 TRINITY_DN10436_c0_g1~~TRINITY_DN10436_c0_g1_i2.p1  ORF type:complete len:526 (+),score=138.09 TRINITY_DN10436_c0_g1_i2:86-1579(+)
MAAAYISPMPGRRAAPKAAPESGDLPVLLLAGAAAVSSGLCALGYCLRHCQKQRRRARFAAGESDDDQDAFAGGDRGVRQSAGGAAPDPAPARPGPEERAALLRRYAPVELPPTEPPDGTPPRSASPRHAAHLSPLPADSSPRGEAQQARQPAGAAAAAQSAPPAVPPSVELEMAEQLSPSALAVAARQLAQKSPDTLTPDDVALALALFGRYIDLQGAGTVPRITGDQLLRTLTSYPRWLLPVGPGPMGVLSFPAPDGRGAMLALCSSEAAIKRLRETHPEVIGQPVPGPEAMRLPVQAEGVTHLAFDPNLSNKMIIIPELQLELLALWGLAVELEFHLMMYTIQARGMPDGGPIGPELRDAIARHPALHVLEAEGGFRGHNGAIMVLVSPDHVSTAIAIDWGRPININKEGLLQLIAEGAPMCFCCGPDSSPDPSVPLYPTVRLSADRLRAALEEAEPMQNGGGAAAAKPASGATPAAAAPTTGHRPSGLDLDLD